MGNSIAESRTDSASLQMRRDIPLCFRLIVQAGVSIELLDGDATNLNKEIIIHVLELLKKSYVFFVTLKILTCYFPAIITNFKMFKLYRFWEHNQLVNHRC